MKATASARKKSAAKAAGSDLPAGQALKSASLPVKSKKRKHRHTIEEVGRSDNAVGDWQQRAGAEGIVDNILLPQRTTQSAWKLHSSASFHTLHCSRTCNRLANGGDEEVRKAEKKRKRACSELQAS
jgi:hypothetical protein